MIFIGCKFILIYEKPYLITMTKDYSNFLHCYWIGTVISSEIVTNTTGWAEKS